MKIPITNTRGEYTGELIRELATDGVKLNVTGIMTVDQIRRVTEDLREGPTAYVSLFAGRVADTGRDPLPAVAEALSVLEPHENLELIWASPRELLNILQADELGCDIITVTHDLLKKLELLGKDLDEFSRETCRCFATTRSRPVSRFERRAA